MAVRRVEGVQDATFSFERNEGYVTYDSTLTSPDVFIAELERITGFKAVVREGEDEGRGQGSGER